MYRRSFFGVRPLSPASTLVLSLVVFSQTCLCEPSPREIANLAQKYILRRGIPLTGVLIYDASSLLRGDSVKLGTSFLSLPTRDKYTPTTSPLLLEALAARQLIVLLFNTGWDSEYSHYTQNIQHKCLLQIIFSKKRVPPVSSSPIYLWFRASAPTLHCSRANDYLLTETLSAEQESCGDPELRCGVTDVRLETVVAFLRSSYSLTLTLSCNKTEVLLHYIASFGARVDNQSVHDAHMRTKYSVCAETTDCYSMIFRASADLTAFVKPFGGDVWIVMCLSVLLTAIIFAWTQPEPISVKIRQMTLNFIAVGAIEANCRKSSVLLLACAILAMTFLLSTIYSNTVMSYFLEVESSEKPDAEKQSADCRFSSFCDLMFTSQRNDLVSRYSMFCSLSERAKQACKGPLRKEVIHDEVRRKAHTEHFQVASCHLQRLFTYKGYIKWTRKMMMNQQLLVLTRSSKTLDRLRQSGVISSRMFERKIHWKEKTLIDIADKTALRQGAADARNQTDWRKYVSFAEEASLFDMAKFREVMPLMLLCGSLILCSAALEQLVSVRIQ